MRFAALLSLWIVACGASPQPSVNAPIKPPIVPAAGPAIGTFWEAQPLDLHPSAIPAEPVTEERLVRLGGAQTAWTEASDDLRARVLKLGFAVVPKGKSGSLADHYRALADAKIPAVLTIDALLAAVHGAMEASFAEVDDVVRVQLEILFRKLDERLTREETVAKPDLAVATQRAHAIVAVARALFDPTFVAGSSPLAKLELEKIWAHVGMAQSPVLDRTVDYSVFDVARGFGDADERVRAFRSVTWLGVAALELGFREEPHGVLPVDRWRTDARAALVFSRLLQRSGEPDAARALERIEDLRGFVLGAPDDLTARELARIAVNAGFDARDEATIANVARLDRVRAAAIAHGAPAFADLVPFVDRKTDRPSLSVSLRLIGPTATPDSVALARLVSPWIGPSPDGRLRALPDALDIGAWLGSREALRIEKEGAFDFEGLSLRLADESAKALPVHDPGACHASLYLTMLEVLATYLGPSAGDPSTLVLGTEWSRRKLDVSLGAWATLRHDVTPFAHTSATLPLLTVAASAAAIDHAIEPHPEAIARLVSFLRQLDKGLTARGLLGSTSAARAMLDDVSALLSAALAASVAAVNGETAPASALLDDLSATFARLEARAKGPLAAGRVADVHADQRSGRVLEVGTRGIDDVWVVLRDPHGQKPTLYVGPHLGHAELAIAPRMTDRAWRQHASQPPAWTREHTITSTSASP